jgi:probable rRNA maturation factor
MPSTKDTPTATRAKGGRPRLSLSVQYAHKAEQVPSRAQFRRWVSASLLPVAQRERGRSEGEIVQVTLRLVNSEEGRALNRDYRGKDYATNVLTFAYGEDEFDPEFSMSGDIVLCAPVVETEARQQGKDLLAHYAHLTVHGLLHLQGYDHESDNEAAIMEASEGTILAKLGFRDPYAGGK